MDKNKQITQSERYQIEAGLKMGSTPSQIALQLKRNKSVISREISRNKGQRGYRAQQAHAMAVARRKRAAKSIKMTPKLTALVEEKIGLDWSPEQISGWLLHEKQILLSHERIYQYIWADKQQGGDLYKHLRCQGKKYEKRRNGKSSRGRIKNATSIDKRPAIVDTKARVGDWEIDTVIGKNHKGAIVTIVERKTRYTVAALVSSKHAAPVTEATIALLAPFKHRVHTITADNGKEFAFHEEMKKQLDCKIYFAHPYSSWERGLNENTNGLLRQYFPKGTDFSKLTQENIDVAVHRINNRPRKILGYKTAANMMIKSLSRAAA